MFLVRGAGLVTWSRPLKFSILIDNHLDSKLTSWDLEDFEISECISLIDDLKPTRLTVFAVGHDGWAQYPSKIARSAPGAARDLPEIWRRLARERGVEFALYVSTLRNDLLVQDRPDWERVRADGFRTGRLDHVSPYREEWLQPLIQELIDRYDPDGFFFDGDYWAVGEGVGPYRQTAAKNRLAVEEPLEQTTLAIQRKLTSVSYDAYLEALGEFLVTRSKPLVCSVNLAFTFRHPVAPPPGLSLITSDLPPFFGPLDAWIETGVVRDEGQAREVVVPLFVEPEGGGRKYPKGADQLVHEIAPLLAADEAVHVYFPMTLRGRLDRTYASALNETRERVAALQAQTPLDRVSFSPDVLCLADSESLPLCQDFTKLRGAMVACSVAGLNVGVASTSRCEARLEATRLLVIPSGRAESVRAERLIQRARELGVRVTGPESPDFGERMNQANWHVDQPLVDLLRSEYRSAEKPTIWSQLSTEHHWSVLARGCETEDGRWRLFFWNSVEKGSALGRHVLNQGAGYAGRVRVTAPPALKIDRVWGFCGRPWVEEQTADFAMVGAFAVVEGSLADRKP